MMRAFTTGPFTGRHITAILVLFFAVVISVNVMMARFATSTFGGVVVENSYVASQHFNRWLDEAQREKTLGWQAGTARAADGRVVVKLIGAPASGVDLIAEARHPLGQLADMNLRFVRQADGSFLSDQPLPAGRWTLRLEASGEAGRWRAEQHVQ